MPPVRCACSIPFLVQIFSATVRMPFVNGGIEAFSYQCLISSREFTPFGGKDSEEAVDRPRCHSSYASVEK